MSRESFIADMRTALGRLIPLSHGQPSQADLRAYFQTLASDSARALEAYQEYARSFYIHTAFVPGDRTGNVEWPGGSCDRWSELASRRRLHGQRVIDCEGYALLAAQLLAAAGWNLHGYQVIYILPTRTTSFDYHLVAVLQDPSDASRIVCIGSVRPAESAVTEAHRVWPDAAFNVRYGSVEATAQAAIDHASRQSAAGPQREVAPMRQRRSSVPPP
jgi:hypothetical protein